MTKKSVTKKKAGQKVSKARSASGKKWIVAVDPFSDLNPLPVANYARAIANQNNESLLGAYVLGPESLNWTGEFSGPWITKYKPVAEKQAEVLRQKLNMPIEVVPCRSPGLRNSVATLAKFAKKVKAEGIVVGTHGRSGLERLVLGSFTETLILTASVPVVIVHPSQPVPTSLRRIVVPTDLSPASIKFISRVGEMAKRSGAAIELFYKLPDPLDPILQQGVYAVGGGWVSVQSYLDDDTRDKEAKLREIVERLKAKGVSAKSTIDTTSTALVPAMNTFAADVKADMIALLTQAGGMTAAILGSVARDLTRTANIPLLISR